MKGTPAVYLGRIVSKEHFRAVVYGAEGKKKLVKSWDEFESSMESGLWFATVEDATGCKAPAGDIEAEGDATPSVKPKSQPKSKSKSQSNHVEPPQRTKLPNLNTSTVFEVTGENE